MTHISVFFFHKTRFAFFSFIFRLNKLGCFKSGIHFYFVVNGHNINCYQTLLGICKHRWWIAQALADFYHFFVWSPKAYVPTHAHTHARTHPHTTTKTNCWVLRVKDAMPISFRLELFTSYIVTILSNVIYSRKYEKLPKIVIHACKNITEKMNLLKMCGPQIRLCLFTYISIDCFILLFLVCRRFIMWMLF